MLAKNIKKFRNKQKLSQEQLAEKAGITYSTLIKIESGQNDNPTIKTLMKISKALRVNLDELLKDTLKPLKVVELFAGVGGFRLGLKEPHYKVVWSNQWEPSTNVQHASEIYTKRFGDSNHSNKNIAEVEVKDIPDHDLLVGGFPCQDYSVARTLNQAAGIVGKKGVLWWDIYRILSKKAKKPKYLLLENVDRLLKSPASQRGRDFAIMLASLSDLGYAVEWRVINAGDYGFPQRRRRVFILGYYKTTSIYNKLKKTPSHVNWITAKGLISKSFPVHADASPTNSFQIKGSLANISKDFNKESSKISPFCNAGVIFDGKVTTMKTAPDYIGKKTLLKDILLDEDKIPDEFFLKKEDLHKWKFLKGAKTISRKSKETGHIYSYGEGPMAFPDPVDKPSRTIVTGEGGSTPSRFKHVVKSGSGRLRRLTPLELERLNMFPDNHTEGASDARRAFFMGNALVVGVVEKLGEQLIKNM